MEPVREWGERVGVGALYVFSLAAFLAPAGAVAGIGIMTLAFPFAVADWRALLRQPAVRVAFLFAVFLVLHSALSAWRRPDLAGYIWDDAGGWLRLVIFVPFGYFLAARPGRLGRLLILVLAGLVAGTLYRLDWTLLVAQPSDFLGSRDGFGFPAIAFALYSGSALLGLILLAVRWWGGSGWSLLRALKLILWLLCLAVLAQALVQTYARGSWIAFLVALGAGLLLSLRRAHHAPAPVRGADRRLLLVVGLIASSALLTLNGERIADRLTGEIETAREVISGERQDVSSSSFGLRWHAQLFGIAAWQQRPWLGWGAGTSRPLMAASGNPQVHGESGVPLKHLHNTYLELLVQFGLVGLSLAGALVLLLVRGLWIAARDGRLPGDYGVFLLSAFVFTLVWSLFDYRCVHQDWRFFWTLLAGSALSFALPVRVEAGPRQEGSA